MSILIDQLIKQSQSEMSEELPGQWFIAKPLFQKRSLWYRLRDALRVLMGNHAYSYHYKADERKDK